MLSSHSVIHFVLTTLTLFSIFFIFDSQPSFLFLFDLFLCYLFGILVYVLSSNSLL